MRNCDGRLAMASGPLEFFELNITCSANTECYTHEYYKWQAAKANQVAPGP